MPNWRELDLNDIALFQENFTRHTGRGILWHATESSAIARPIEKFACERVYFADLRRVMTVKVLFVCMGNICRSPTAEAVFRARVEQEGLGDRVFIDSAGTHDYHIGEPPDSRMQRAAAKRGYDMSDLRGRQVGREDFGRFDYVLAMDENNLAILERLRPRDAESHLGLFLEFAGRHEEREVPDPYYGGSEGFERVLDMVEDAADGLLLHIRQHHL
jgi:low molecular weight protein-tyrosine phosphatase